MAKEIKFKMVKEDFDEDIEVLELYSDRIIIEPYFIAPKKVSTIINPETTKPYESPDWDRYPRRGIVVAVGKEVAEKGYNLQPLDRVFIEDPNALVHLPMNGKNFFRTRISNVILVFKQNARGGLKLEK